MSSQFVSGLVVGLTVATIAFPAGMLGSEPQKTQPKANGDSVAGTWQNRVKSGTTRLS